MLHIAYFSPLPPQQSGIADYSRELLPYLSQLAQVTVFATAPGIALDEDPSLFSLAPLEEFVARPQAYDLALYHVGNSEHHDKIAELAMRYPGVVVLHDYVLHHSVARRTVGSGDPAAYWRELSSEAGVEGVRLFSTQDPTDLCSPFDLPLNRRLVSASLGVIVHSRYSARLLRRQGYRGPLVIVPAPIAALTGQPQRAKLGIPDDVPLFASFGLLTQEKQIAEAMRALRRLREDIPAHYLLVGEPMPNMPVKENAKTLGIERAVHITGYVPTLADFVDWIYSADVVINLRHPTAGETSATALRAMAAGKPLIVTDQGWYRELPDEVSVKVPPNDEDSLVEAMRGLSQSAALRQRMGDAGQRYTREVNHPESVATRYMEALAEIGSMVRIYD